MNIMKNLAALTVVSAFILAGCQNNFTGTTLDTSSLTAQNRSVTTWNNVSTSTVSVSNDKNQTITIDFNNTVDATSIDKAISMKQVSNGSSATTCYTQGAAVPYTVKTINGTSVDFNVDLTGVTSGAIEIYLDATKLTARGGSTLLNTDGDNVPGEANDDDKYLYVGITGTGVTALTTGVERNPQALFPLTINLPTPSATTTNILTATYSNFADDPADYKNLLTANLTVEKFDVATKTWVTVPATSTSYATGTGTFTYNFASATAGGTYRYKLSNVQSIVTSSAVYGYVQRYSMDANLTAVYGTPLNLGQKYVDDPLNVTVSFNMSQGADYSGLNAYIDLEYSIITGDITGDRGIDETTFTTSNVKLFNKDKNVFETISSISFLPVATGATKKTIRIYLDPTFKPASTETFDVLAGTGVKTLGDATPGIEAGYLGDPSNIQDLPYGIGYTIIGTVAF